MGIKSRKERAIRKAANRVGGTMFEYIGTSKSWNPNEGRHYKGRGDGKVGEPANECRSVEITAEMRARYENK